MNTVIWSLILIRNTATTVCNRWCCMLPLILQLSLYSLVVKSVPVALSSRKFHNMSNGVRGDNVRRAGSKSQFCSSPLILRFTYAAGWQMTQCVVQAASLFLGHSLLLEWWVALSRCGSSCCIRSQSQGRATVQQQPVEDGRAITKLEVTSVSPEVTKESPTVGPIKDELCYFYFCHQQLVCTSVRQLVKWHLKKLKSWGCQALKNTHCWIIAETGYH